MLIESFIAADIFLYSSPDLSGNCSQISAPEFKFDCHGTSYEYLSACYIFFFIKLVCNFEMKMNFGLRL